MFSLQAISRSSQLALWQTQHIKQKLETKFPGLKVNIQECLTSGDKWLQSSLNEHGGKGLFVKKLETALLDGTADFAVHSLKDVPAQLPAGLELVGFPERDSPNDCLVSNSYTSLDELPKNAVVGTASLRRRAALLAYRPDLQIRLLRGNLQTRLRKLDEGRYDAIVLAVAGLQRLGLENRIQQIIPHEILLPAVCQGVLAVEARKDNPHKQLLASLNHQATLETTLLERRIGKNLQVGCHVPISIYAKHLSFEEIQVQVQIWSLDGSRHFVVQDKTSVSDSLSFADKISADIQSQAAALLEEAKGADLKWD